MALLYPKAYQDYARHVDIKPLDMLDYVTIICNFKKTAELLYYINIFEKGHDGVYA